MKKYLLFACLFVTSIGYSQTDTSYYADSSRVTTTFSRVYIGPKMQKYVYISADTTSSTQTLLIVFGAAADTNNPAKKIVLRLSKNTILDRFFTRQDTVRVKTLGGSVPGLIISVPIPQVQR